MLKLRVNYIVHLLIRLFLFFFLSTYALSAQKHLELKDTTLQGKVYWGYKQAGRYVIKPHYTLASAFQDDRALVKEGDFFYFITSKGTAVKSLRFADAFPFSEGLAAVRFSEGWGFVNGGMKVVVKPKFLKVLPFSEGYAPVKDRVWYFIDKKGVNSLKLEYDTVVASFKNGVAIVGKRGDGWKFGVVNKAGQWLVPCSYSEIKRISEALLLAVTEDKFQDVFNLKGKKLLDQVENVASLGDTLFLYEKNAKQHLIDPSGNGLHKEGFKSFRNGKVEMFPNWKLMDSSSNVVASYEADSFLTRGAYVFRCLNDKKQLIYPQQMGSFYAHINPLVKGFGVYRSEKWAVMNEKGETVTPFQYDHLKSLGDNILFLQNGRVGLLDSNFRTILSPHFDLLKIYPKSENVFFVQNQYAGFLKLGDTSAVLKVEADSLTPLGSSWFRSWKNGSFQLLDQKLEPISPKQFWHASMVSDTQLIASDVDSLYQYHLQKEQWMAKKEKVLAIYRDTLALIRLDTLFGVHHFGSDSLWTFEADTVFPHPNMDTRLVTKKGKWLGLVNLEGKLLTSYNRQFYYLGREENGFMQVISRKKYGFIDTNGYLLIATQYDSVNAMSQGYAAVKIKGKWGFVNRKEVFVVQPNYTRAGPFSNGKAAVWVAALATLVDNNGQELFKPRFHGIYPTKTGYWLTLKGTNYGFLDGNGKELIAPKFSRAEETPFGCFIVTQYGRTGIVNRKLEEVLPLGDRRIEWIKGTHLFCVEEKR